MNFAQLRKLDRLGDHQAEFWQRIECASEYVYFIQGDPGTPIKIGYTTDVHGRMDSLQTGNPHRLRLLVVLPGSRQLEVAYHRLLSNDRVRGEWFQGVVVDEVLEDARDASITMMRIWDERQWLADPFQHLALVSAPKVQNPKSMPDLPASTRQQRVTGDFAGRGLRRSWPMSQRKVEPLTIRFVDPGTMDRTPSRLRSRERPVTQHHT